ncbi:hypothetical protein NYE47_00985 [Paenibacillus sp. FSL H7-0941]
MPKNEEEKQWISLKGSVDKVSARIFPKTSGDIKRTSSQDVTKSDTKGEH